GPGPDDAGGPPAAVGGGRTAGEVDEAAGEADPRARQGRGPLGGVTGSPRLPALPGLAGSTSSASSWALSDFRRPTTGKAATNGLSRAYEACSESRRRCRS